MKENKYLFTITYLECDSDGSYWSKETNTHTVKVIASTTTEAIEKMKKVTGVKLYKNLCWDCEEIENIKEESPYCEVCGTCGDIECCGINVKE